MKNYDVFQKCVSFLHKFETQQDKTQIRLCIKTKTRPESDPDNLKPVTSLLNTK